MSQPRHEVLADILTPAELRALGDALDQFRADVALGQLRADVAMARMRVGAARLGPWIEARIVPAEGGRLRVHAGKLGPGPWPSEQQGLTTPPK